MGVDRKMGLERYGEGREIGKRRREKGRVWREGEIGKECGERERNR